MRNIAADPSEEHGPSYRGLLLAISKAGGTQTALADVLDVGQPEVHRMLHSKKPLKPEHCTTLERELGIPRALLRPDDYWRIWPDLPAPPGAFHKRKRPIRSLRASPSSDAWGQGSHRR